MIQSFTSPIRLELPTGLPVGTVNTYLFTEPEPVLVDTGLKSEESLNTLKSGLVAHNLQIADLTKVIVSHPHIDHFGLAATIAAESKAEICILEDAVEWLTDYTRMWRQRVEYYANTLFKALGLPDEIAQPIIDYYIEVADAAEQVPAERMSVFKADDFLQIGGISWRVLHTPGHAATLTCFYQPESKQFLSTDMLLHLAPTPIVDPPTPGQSTRVPSLPLFIESLKLVEALDIDMVFPGHGEPFTNHIEVIANQRHRIELRKKECLRLVQGGEHKVGQLLLKMYAHYPPQFRFAGLWMIIGYLDLLKKEGLLSEETVNGIWHYRARNET